MEIVRTCHLWAVLPLEGEKPDLDGTHTLVVTVPLKESPFRGGLFLQPVRVTFDFDEEQALEKLRRHEVTEAEIARATKAFCDNITAIKAKGGVK